MLYSGCFNFLHAYYTFHTRKWSQQLLSYHKGVGGHLPNYFFPKFEVRISDSHMLLSIFWHLCDPMNIFIEVQASQYVPENTEKIGLFPDFICQAQEQHDHCFVIHF